MRPSPELVKLVKTIYTERNLDAKFLLPVFSGFTRVRRGKKRGEKSIFYYCRFENRLTSPLPSSISLRFLSPSLNPLSPGAQDEIKRYLPKIVELLNNTEPQQRVVKNVLSRILKGSSNASAVISAQDLLVGLHELEDSVPLTKANEGKEPFPTYRWRTGKPLTSYFTDGVAFFSSCTHPVAIKLCFEMLDISKSEVQ